MASNTSMSKYDFIAEPDSALQCVICLDVAEDPRQHEECGRLLCKECLEKYGRDKPCPNCRREQPQYFKDNRGIREINALRIKCSNANRGCEQVETVGTLKKHVATCGFTLVLCPKQCKDDNDDVQCFIRKNQDKHLKNDCPNRDYECQSKCGEKGSYAYITGAHDKICKMKILSCPNAGCGTKIQRQQVSEHVSKCPHTVIPCKYKGIGCDTELEREDMEAHEQDDKLHLHMALDTVNIQQSAINIQQSAINIQQSAINKLERTTKLQQVAIDSLQAAVKSLQVEGNLQHDRLMLLKYEGSETFKLSEYLKKKAATKLFRFPPFYTHHNGYHMALGVYANGFGPGEGTHVSVSVGIPKGEYDNEVEWPFVGEIRIILLNQLEDKNHYIKTMTIDCTHNALAGSFWDYHNFISHSELAQDPVNTQYLKNDTLYFRIEVETEHNNEW